MAVTTTTRNRIGYRLAIGAVVCPLLLWAGGLSVRADTGDTMEEIVGVYLGQGVECPQALLSDGEQISLEGTLLPTMTEGQTIRMSGQFLRMSRCMQGRAFRVETLTIEAAKD